MPHEPSPPPRSTMRFCSDEQRRQPICNRGADGLRRLPPACGVARLRAAETERPPVIWLCDHGDCHAAAQKVYAMPIAVLDAYEIGAALEAGAEAASYLEGIGKTDLARLSRDEWREFLRLFLVGYERAMRRKILNSEAPF